MGMTKEQIKAVFDACPIGEIFAEDHLCYLYKTSSIGAWWVYKDEELRDYIGETGWEFFASDFANMPGLTLYVKYLLKESQLDEYTWE